ncbi:U3 snoRNP protein [Boothiomyces macroporosus]|uniref:U3 small nucleolar ribonucleoprotein protein MPP10 n=1 Tax=Boothiomyces macroporosus TaxID=261099 RepID=A0AAD5UQH4_9FUNG|nr:U3 snoRNP protein [Boothiomyces macroporosus]
MENPIDESFMNQVLNQPQRFLKASQDPELANSYLEAVQYLYKKAKSFDTQNLSFLPEITTEGFDSNQIWEQLKLFNEPALEYFDEIFQGDEIEEEFEGESDDESENEYDAMLEEADAQQFDESAESDDEKFDNGPELEEYEDEMDQDEELEEYEEPLEDEDNEKPKPKRKRSEVDDDFFSLEEMERFADLSEARDNKLAALYEKKLKGEDIEEELDDDDEMFTVGKDMANGVFDYDEDDDDDNANDIKYSDFFEAPEKSKSTRKSWRDDMEPLDEEKEDDDLMENKDDGAEIDQIKDLDELEGDIKEKSLFDDEEEEDTDAPLLSTFEKEQLERQKEIEMFEAENMAVKDWTLRGEVSSKSRPVNSLLEEDLDVDIAVKPVPVITEETTKTLADMILQRIKDQAFDDVVRKAPPKDSVYDPNRRWELDDQKNQKSLAEIYEEEYQRQTSKTEIKSARDLEVEKHHQEINELFNNLSQQLDALSNWHYTPKAAELELVVVPNASVPAISMEEIIPASVSTAKLAVPQEVYDGKVAKSQAELDAADKKKLRVRAKRKIANEKRERERAKKLVKTSEDLQSNITKANAMKQLMKQDNVTLVVDPRNKKQFSKGNANVIDKGGKITKEKVSQRPEMLKL